LEQIMGLFSMQYLRKCIETHTSLAEAMEQLGVNFDCRAAEGVAHGK
jgi:hypothetical protein